MELPDVGAVSEDAVISATSRLALRLPVLFLGCFGPRVARLVAPRAGCVRIIVEAQDLPPRRTTSHAVANYVRAVLELRALRREVAHKLLEVERCRKAIESRLHAEVLLAEAQTLLEELGLEVANDNRSAQWAP
jgi:hypothetical protein